MDSAYFHIRSQMIWARGAEPWRECGLPVHEELDLDPAKVELIHETSRQYFLKYRQACAASHLGLLPVQFDNVVSVVRVSFLNKRHRQPLLLLQRLPSGQTHPDAHSGYAIVRTQAQGCQPCLQAKGDEAERCKDGKHADGKAMSQRPDRVAQKKMNEQGLSMAVGKVAGHFPGLNITDRCPHQGTCMCHT